MNGRGLTLRNGRDGRKLREGQASAGVTISQLWEHLRATVAAVCFQSPSNLYSDHHCLLLWTEHRRFEQSAWVHLTRSAVDPQLVHFGSTRFISS
jgi:hypothetical protein